MRKFFRVAKLDLTYSKLLSVYPIHPFRRKSECPQRIAKTDGQKNCFVPTIRT